MPADRDAAPLNLFVAVGGHPFEEGPFRTLFEGFRYDLVYQPEAARKLNPEGMAGYDAVVLYDMPGVDFQVTEDRPRLPPPEQAVQEGFTRLLQAGKGIVALHHAIAGWPAWAQYAEFLGGAYLYKPGLLRGRPHPDSGYRHDVTYDAVNLRPAHPVLRNTPARFSVTDELYLYEVFEDDVLPLLRADRTFRDDEFYSSIAAMRGKLYDNTGWRRPPGSDLVGWAKPALQSPLVYLQLGHGPETYANPHYRQLLADAITWAASPEAAAWAKAGLQSTNKEKDVAT